MAKPLSMMETEAAVWNIIKVAAETTVTDKAKLPPKKSSEDIRKKQNRYSESPSECPICHKMYKRALNLRRHVISIHKIKYVDVQSKLGSIKCGFDAACEATFDRSIFYRKHLNKIHKVDLGKKVLYFDNIDDFEAWKCWEQGQIGAKFVKRYNRTTPSQTNLNVKKVTFLCACSVQSKMKDKILKRRSRKIDSCCPARMDAVLGVDNIIVSYFSTHIGHLMETTETLLKRAQKRQCDARRRKRRVFLAAKQRAQALCSELLQKIESDRYTTEYMVDIAVKIEGILNASQNHMQESLPAENEVADLSCDDNSPNESTADIIDGFASNNPRSILKRRTFTSSFNRSKKSDENYESEFSNMDEEKGNLKLIQDDNFKGLRYVKYHDHTTPFCGKVNFVSLVSQPTDGPLEKKIRKHGFLYNLESITPVIARDMLKDDYVFPNPPSVETKTLYENVWNKYRNSLGGVSHSDHDYTGS